MPEMKDGKMGKIGTMSQSNPVTAHGIFNIICHDGKIYMYSAAEDISKDYYNLTVAEYIKQGYNEFDAQIKAIEEIKEKFEIKFKEVTDNDV